jgi:anti-anti-sigma factor
MLSIGIGGEVLFLRAEGEMRAGICFALGEFLGPYLEKVKKKITIMLDLSECTYMDSTFIGFIISLAKKCEKYFPERVEIVNPSPRCEAVLEKLCCMNTLSIVRGRDLPAVTLFELEPPARAFGSRMNVELMFRAHKSLSELSEENRRAFKDLLDELKGVLDGGTDG